MDRDGEDPGLPVLEEDHHGPRDLPRLYPHECRGAGVLQDPLQELLSVAVLLEADRLEHFKILEVAEVRVSKHRRLKSRPGISRSRKD